MSLIKKIHPDIKSCHPREGGDPSPMWYWDLVEDGSPPSRGRQRGPETNRVLIIDNYDSFVFNLSRYVEELGHVVKVARNNNITLSDIHFLQPSHIIISPGPRGPTEAGMSIAIVQEFAGIIPILGVCLGHQVIGHVFGAHIARAKEPMHGKSCLIHHDGQGIFHGIPNPLRVGRYHSLIVLDEGLNYEITVTSRSAAGEIMSFSSQQLRLFGVQFHPESVLTKHGHELINNFLDARV